VFSSDLAATEVEARTCSDDAVAIVGGGNSAGQAAVFLSGYARRVYLLVRSGDLGRGMSRYLADRLQRTGNVEVLLCTEVEELLGEGGRLEGVVARDNPSGKRRVLDARALFVFIGAEPYTGWLEGTLALDGRGFVLTGRDLDRSALDPEVWAGILRDPFLLETSLPGVFAAGDVRSGSVKRVASAVGEGAMAVRFVHQYLAEVGVSV